MTKPFAAGSSAYVDAEHTPPVAVEVPLACFSCGDPNPPEDHGVLSDKPACLVDSAGLGDVVRISHMYAGTKALQATIFRVTALPDPKAPRKVERECYQITPIIGGRPTRISLDGLLKPSPAEVARAAASTEVAPLGEGFVVVAVTARLTGVVAERDLLVVTKASPDGTVTVHRLGGGAHWSKVPGNLLRHVVVPAEVS